MLRLFTQERIYEEMARLDSEMKAMDASYNVEIRKVSVDRRAGEGRNRELTMAIRQYERLAAYVKEDMTSPRYQALDSDAKELVDGAYRDFVAALKQNHRAQDIVAANLAGLTIKESLVRDTYQRFKTKHAETVSSLYHRFNILTGERPVCPKCLCVHELYKTPTTPNQGQD